MTPTRPESAGPAAQAPRPGRLVLDVSSLARWAGPPAGIVRIEQELLNAARADRPDIVPAVFDPARGHYRSIREAWSEVILSGDGAVVLSDGPALARRGWRAWIPRQGEVMMALDGWRLTTRLPWLASVIDRAQRLAAHLPHRWFQLLAPGGSRFAYVPEHVALGDAIALGPGDTVVTAGYDWLRKTPAQVKRLKAGTGIRYVATCHDMIPVLFPAFYAPEEADGFRRYWAEMLPVVDTVITNSQRTVDDLTAWARAEGVPLPRVVKVPLGSSIGLPGATIDPALPEGLIRGHYILMVGTIEPRKGHRLLLDIWHELMAKGVPQQSGFTLVFAGRRGWKTDALMREIEQGMGPHFVHLHEVWDARLERLYRDCAFCVLPSVYEGFGLPVIEAYSHGKAIISSTGGSLPEVVGDLSPCVDLACPEAWRALIERWMLDPDARLSYEQRITTSFSRPAWSAVAAGFWRAALEEDGQERP